MAARYQLKRLHLNDANGIDGEDLIDVPTSSGDPVWGGITGTLSGQSDLQAALDAKQASGNYLTSGGALGTPASGVGTNLTGTAAGLTAGTVTTNANLTGHVTSTGNAAILGSFTLAQLNTAISNADVASGGGTCTGSDSGTNTGDNATNSQYSGLAAQIVIATSFKRTFALMGC